MFYVKRYNLKTQVTTLEGSYEEKELAEKLAKELLDTEEKKETSTCIFAVEDIKEDMPYEEIYRGVLIQMAGDMGLPPEVVDEEFVEKFKKGLETYGE